MTSNRQQVNGRHHGSIRKIGPEKFVVQVLRGYVDGDTKKPRYKQRTVYGNLALAELHLRQLDAEYGHKPGTRPCRRAGAARATSPIGSEPARPIAPRTNGQG